MHFNLLYTYRISVVLKCLHELLISVHFWRRDCIKYLPISPMWLQEKAGKNPKANHKPIPEPPNRQGKRSSLYFIASFNVGDLGQQLHFLVAGNSTSFNTLCKNVCGEEMSLSWKKNNTLLFECFCSLELMHPSFAWPFRSGVHAPEFTLQACKQCLKTAVLGFWRNLYSAW